MFQTLAASIVAATVAVQPAAQPPGHTDQTLPVQRGARLVVNDFAGEIVVRAWDKDAVRVEADHSERDRIDIKASDLVVNVRPRSSFGPPRAIDLRISVPAWMRLDLSGTYTDVTVEGSQGEISVETVRGDVKVRGGSGFVSLKSVEGLVTLEGARGKVNVSSVNESIRVSDVSGDITAETINGGVTLERIQADSVDVATVNGNLSFDGAIRDSARYRLTTHNGDVLVIVPDRTNATVSARTFNGDFASDFPLKPDDTRDSRRRRFTVVLGSGSARIDLESFGGTIRLRRPGQKPKE